MFARNTFMLRERGSRIPDRYTFMLKGWTFYSLSLCVKGIRVPDHYPFVLKSPLYIYVKDGRESIQFTFVLEGRTTAPYTQVLNG